ncbi:LysR substrate-binding domain-containing protein [Novosphingobium sp. CCH12-A3]|uniref:LysR substrate-binding domain-containing protein n=1 Tax=Novosphingobium sp. CCH12-A3 TaxID=1768752 RepID=UPI00078033B3|nr:LysR substrate-binding domain-containing protein [Novosphingobium sp. CCH12-A3]
MSRRTYNLPPLSTLTTFEAAARHLSFKNAAGELGVTPGAVSHQVKALEAELKVPLFRRVHQRVLLTAQGAQLYSTLLRSFTEIANDLRAIRESGGEKRVTIGATSAVAQLWIADVLAGFWRDHPDVTVDQVISDHGFGKAPTIDMYISYGQDHRAGWEQRALYCDEMIVVGSPAMAERLRNATIADIAAERLVHLDAAEGHWTTWSDWFRAHGVPEPEARGLRANNSMIVLRAAMDGQGLALGWRRLMAPLLESGRLAVCGPHRMASPHGYYLVSRVDSELSTPARMLREWICNALQEG